MEVDTSDADAVARAFGLALDAYGHIDVLFNNAGIVGEQMPLHETTDAVWRQVMAVNADGAFHVLRAGLKAMLAGQGGAIVNTSSSTGLAGKPNMTPYSFSSGAGRADPRRGDRVRRARDPRQCHRAHGGHDRARRGPHRPGT